MSHRVWLGVGGMVLQQSKKELRQEMKIVLSNLDKRWALKAHSEVCEHLTGLVNAETSTSLTRHVVAWVPCFPGEVDLTSFIGQMLRGSYVYLPRVAETGVMSFVRVFDDWAQNLEPGARGVVQPRRGYGESFRPEDEGVIVVVTPGMAFDATGKRLGRGGGHYDRFLGDPRLSRAIKIGVCWSLQIVPQIPVDNHDIAMDFLCHERGVVQVRHGAL